MRKPMHPRDRCQGLLDEAEQMIRDIQYWNNLHPDDPPFDCERERVIAMLARQALAWWDSGCRNSGVFEPLYDYVTVAYSNEVESEGPI